MSRKSPLTQALEAAEVLRKRGATGVEVKVGSVTVSASFPEKPPVGLVGGIGFMVSPSVEDDC